VSFLETYLLVWVDDIFGLAEAINHGIKFRIQSRLLAVRIIAQIVAIYSRQSFVYED
jgi:hypothetical protein